MKTGTYTWFGYKAPMAERMRMIRDAGFECVMLWWGEQFGDENGERRLLPDLARRAGLCIDHAHAEFLGVDALWSEGPEGDVPMKRFLDCIDDCAEFGMPTMVMHVAGFDERPRLSEVGRSRLARIVDRAEARGVNVALENVVGLEHLRFALDNIDSARLGLCFDSGHSNSSTPAQELLDRYGGRLMALHLHDNDGTRDQHQCPGRGTIDWPALAANLAALGWSRTVMLESHDLSIKADAARARDYLKATHAWAVRFGVQIESAKTTGFAP